MSDRDMIENLGDSAGRLEGSLSGAVGMAEHFDGALKRIQTSFGTTGQQATRLETTLSRGVARAMDGVVLDGLKLSDALKVVATSLVDAAWKAAVRPVSQGIGGIIAQGVTGLFGAAVPFAQGGAFAQGRVTPFAKGGLVTGPTSFPMRGGTGLMGEAGPEAIMPLTRGPDGALGVRAAAGGQPMQVVMNISTPDAQSFQRSQSQIAARMARALDSGARNR